VILTPHRNAFYNKIISLSEIRARKQWDRLRQDLTGGLTETILTHAHADEQSRKQAPCPQCDRLLTARPAMTRTVETLVGVVQFERPYFYCRTCRRGFYPFDEVLHLAPGRLQLDVQQAAAKVVIEMPYDEAQTFYHDLTGVSMGSERMHTLTNHAAQGLTVLDVAPSREQIEERIAAVAAGTWRRPVVVLGIDADVPTSQLDCPCCIRYTRRLTSIDVLALDSGGHHDVSTAQTAQRRSRPLPEPAKRDGIP
jgi:hypothetical protein